MSTTSSEPTIDLTTAVPQRTSGDLGRPGTPALAAPAEMTITAASSAANGVPISVFGLAGEDLVKL